MNKENIKCHNLGLAVKNTWEGGGGGGGAGGQHPQFRGVFSRGGNPPPRGREEFPPTTPPICFSNEMG
jgi:hypothetical protein